MTTENRVKDIFEDVLQSGYTIDPTKDREP